MSDCIFCKIVNGELPCHKIYEDNDFLAFLDINPLSKGNSLLIPKKHHRWVYDVPEFGRYWEIAQKIALSSINALEADSISFLTIGYEVPHAHIRIIPRFTNDAHQQGIDFKHHEKYSPDEMIQICSLINDSLKS